MIYPELAPAILPTFVFCDFSVNGLSYEGFSPSTENTVIGRPIAVRSIDLAGFDQVDVIYSRYLAENLAVAPVGHECVDLGNMTDPDRRGA